MNGKNTIFVRSIRLDFFKIRHRRGGEMCDFYNYIYTFFYLILLKTNYEVQCKFFS